MINPARGALLQDIDRDPDRYRFYLYNKGRVLMPPEVNDVAEPAWTRDAIEPLLDGRQDLLQTDVANSTRYVAVECRDPDFLPNAQDHSLLGVVLRQPDDVAMRLGKGAQLLNWYAQHRYCGACGAHTLDQPGMYCKRCPQCGLMQYPKVAPCMITLVVRGDRCLLARHGGVRGRWHTTLAGFVEPGESLEQALRREVREEVGIEVDTIRYFSSQPWPFPSQLMVGFFAKYAGGEIVVDGVEIEEANWFERGELPEVPGEFSIAGRLIKHFEENRL